MAKVAEKKDLVAIQLLRYRPELRIDTTTLKKGDPYFDEMHTEMSEESITPRTFESRKLISETPFRTQSEGGAAAAEETRTEHLVFYQDTYSYGKNSVVRFGFNVHSADMKAGIEAYNKGVSGTKLDLKSLASSNSKGSGSKQKEHSKESSMAADKTLQHQEIADPREQARALLTEYEMENTKAAIQYLMPDVEHIPKRKTVLVDIFDRTATNKVKKQEDGIFKTHTVVLYEQDGQYLVIDPSNAEFSTILIGVDPNIRVCTTKAKCTIYKPMAETGPNLYQPRDCVDVAAKLAFSLSVHSKLPSIPAIEVKEFDNGFGHIDFASLKEHPSVVDITNNTTDICKELPNMLTKSPFRIKQSSNILLDKKITTALKFLHSVKKTLYKNLDSHGFEHCKDIMDRKFDNLTSYDSVVQLSVELSSYTDAQLLGIENAAIQDAFGDFI